MDGFLLLDRDLRVVYANPPADVAATLHERHPLRVWLSWSGTEVERRFRAALKSGRPEYFEHFYPAAALCAEIHAYPSDEGLAVYFHDTTERRRAESEHARIERAYLAALSNTPDLVYVFDLNHRFTYANQALLTMWGRTWEDSIGKNCQELGYPDWHAAMHDREIETVVAKKAPIRGVVPFSGTHGRRFYDYIFVPVFGNDGTIEAVAGTTRDVTEQHHAEEALRTSERRFRALVEASSDVIYRMSPDWREMHQLQGRDFIPDTEVPDPDWMEKYIHPDEQARVFAAIQEAVHARSVFQLEHRVLRVDGSPGWTFSRAVPLLDPDGQIAEWFGAASDITPRKQAEEALIRTEKLASLGRMAATIAHEINNPLESLTNLLFLARTAEGLPDPVRRHLELADTELKRVAHITRQSLGFYREFNAPARISLNDLLESAIDLLRSKINSKKATIQTEWRTDMEVTAVAGEIRQVLSNFLSNALDAIPREGVIRIRTSRCLWKAIPSVRVTVADYGNGIDRASRQHLFEPFFTTKGTFGTGLGLWVSRQIIEKHRGVIQVRSRSTGPVTGTAFSIVLPVESRLRSSA